MADREGLEDSPGSGAAPGQAFVQDLSAVTMAMSRRRSKAGGEDRVDAVLEKQARMLDAQLEHMHEQRELTLSRLRWSRFSDRMKAALQLMTAFIGLLIAMGVGGAVWDAVHADSVVVDPFQTPPSLVAQGLNGTVVASGLLDELTRMQSETRSVQAKRGFKDAWSNDIKVDVPDTGVSIGELVRDLHHWLGHETHVTGDLVQAQDGIIRLTVRGDGVAAKSFTGPPADLPKLTTEAAEYVYSEAEPYFATSYLESQGRDAEAIKVVENKYATDRPQERPFLLNVWANGLLDLGQVDGALPKYQEALRLNPNYWTAYTNIINTQLALGREADAWRTAKAFAAKSRRGKPGQRAEEYYFNYADLMSWNLQAERDGMIADMEAHGGEGSNIVQDGPLIADVAIRMHDPVAADLYLQTSANAATDPFAIAMAHFVHGYGALDRGDFARAAAELEPFAVAYATPAIGLQIPGYNCWLAPAEELAGHPDKADAALKAGGRFVDCWRFRADILDHRGDWPGAQKAYADAVALAPDLPAAWYSWGLALARHGDQAVAEAKFAAANARGPHWADPLKAWGDALAAQRRFPEADARYAEAVRYAPKWLALHLAYGDALRAEGRFREAIAQYHAVIEASGHG